MPDRRSCLHLACLAPLLSLSDIAFGMPSAPVSDESAIADMINAWCRDKKNKKHFEFSKPGTKGSLKLAPEDIRVREAARFLVAVPKTLTPLDVAKHMIENLPENQRMEWPADRPNDPQPANPLIIAFFAATHTAPTAGDQTAWCAAFACWALQHASITPEHPHNAGSRAFRTWSSKTTDPQPGDIAVFRSKRMAKKGHVGFFDGFVDGSKSRIYLVGGNQSNQINRLAWNLDKPTLAFDSFRTAPGLRKVMA
jgi:uncharacterized protein (TIGR02594 family)